MIRTPRISLFAFAAFASVVALASASAPARAAGGIKAAYVEEVIPAKTFTMAASSASPASR
jgi:hypothetical protein